MKALVKASNDVAAAKDDEDALKKAWPTLIEAAKKWKKGTTKAYTTEATNLAKSLKKEKETFEKEMKAAQTKVDEQLKKDTKKEKENKQLKDGTALYKKGVEDLVAK